MVVFLVMTILSFLKDNTQISAQPYENRIDDITNQTTVSTTRAYHISDSLYVFSKTKDNAIDAKSDCGPQLTITTIEDKVPFVARLSMRNPNVENVTTVNCWANLTSPQNTVMSLLLLNTECYSKGHLNIMDASTSLRWQICLDSDIVPIGSDFTTTSNVVNVSFVITYPLHMDSLQINVQTVIELTGRELEIRYLTATEGYVQTPGFSPRKDLHFSTDSAVFIQLPQDHVIMVTVLYMFSEEGYSGENRIFDLYVIENRETNTLTNHHNFLVRTYPDAVKILKYFKQIIQKKRIDIGFLNSKFWLKHPGDSDSTLMPDSILKEKSQIRKVWPLYDTTRPDTEVLDARNIYILFNCIGRLCHPHQKNNHINGGRIFFSIHKPDRVPKRLRNGKWNCSVPHYPEFKLHFKCNHKEECFSGRDEQTCLYKPCEHGGVAMFGSCYFYFPGNPLTWLEAQQNCRKAGAKLASLSSTKEWYNVLIWLRMVWKTNRIPDIRIGLFSANLELRYMYETVMRWDDTTTAILDVVGSAGNTPMCGSLRYFSFIRFYPCSGLEKGTPLCEKDEEKNVMPFHHHGRPGFKSSVLKVPSVPHIVCPSGHFTHDLSACDTMSHCWGKDLLKSSTWREQPAPLSCSAPLPLLPPSFACSSGGENIPFSMVCDHSPDCWDLSDEDFCYFPPCMGQGQFMCNSRQCLPSITHRCNNITDCRDASDEKDCDDYFKHSYNVVPPPALVRFDIQGNCNIQPLDPFAECPETHFGCLDGYCLPVFMLCNGLYDCPEHEDEEGCDSMTCAGYYRCRGSTVCLHVSYVCDGLPQCPQHDDELFCNLTCPDECVCFGHAFICNQTFPCHIYKELRYLDASSSGIKTDNFENNIFLVFLRLARCSMTRVGNTVLPNLQTLDVSYNLLQNITVFDVIRFPKLKFLSLAGNPLTSFVRPDEDHSVTFKSIIKLDLSFVTFSHIDEKTFIKFSNIQILNLSQSKVEKFHDGSLKVLNSLQVLDVTGCPMTSIPGSIFNGLDALQRVVASNYKVCCPEILPPGFVLQNCKAPFDEISSCDALLRSDVYRISLGVFASLSTIGNTMSFIFRVFVIKNTRKSGFAALVIHLCVADFLMGVYLVIIGVADRIYLNKYQWEDDKWKASVVCHLAGFLSLLSSEMSAFVICLVTVDRFLVLRFPFSHLRFEARSAHATCTALWVTAVIIAAIPLLPALSHWTFYSHTGLCIPLPITRETFSGHGYAFGVMIVFNFVLFLFIAAGQISIYTAVRSQSMSGKDSTGKSKDLAVARRLFTIVFSDFLCWFPIGLLGLLASRGIPIPGEVNVSMAIFVLPFNSTLNPFLYTVNLIWERRIRTREERFLKAIHEQIESEARNM